MDERRKGWSSIHILIQTKMGWSCDVSKVHTFRTEFRLIVSRYITDYLHNDIQDINICIVTYSNLISHYIPCFSYYGTTGWEAIMNLCPDVYVDTSGYAFTLPLFKILGNSQVGCYIHYPTISTDMLTQVKSRTSTYNNNSRISNSWALSYLKLQYYKVYLNIFKM